MPKVMFTISYDIRPDKRDEYLALSREMKSYMTGSSGRDYTIYEHKGKQNRFSEIFVFNSMEEYDALEDHDETMSHMVERLEAFLVNGRMKYSTLLEVSDGT